MSTTAIIGTSSSDLDLSGGDGKDILIGKAGDDTLNGGAGSDALLGGAGNDILVYDQFDWKIDGGTGYDTLRFLGDHQVLDLTNNKVVSNIEQMQLWGYGGHQVLLSAADVIRVSDNDAMRLWGNSSNSLTFHDSGWNFQNIVVENGGQFSVFTNGGATVKTEFTLNVTGFSYDAQITVNGANDLYEDLDAYNNPVPSEGYLMARGTILVTDHNPGQDYLLSTGTFQNGLGTLKVEPAMPNPNGPGHLYAYTYIIANSDVQYLNADQTYTNLFSLTTFDGTTKTLEFITHGSDEFVFDTSPINASITEYTTDDGALHNTGMHTTSDTFAATGSTSVTWAEDAGNLPYLGEFTATLNSGVVDWQYEVNDRFLNYLHDGETVTQSYTIKVDFGDKTFEKTIAINLIGTADTNEFNGSFSSVFMLHSPPAEAIARSISANIQLLLISIDQGYLYGHNGNENFVLDRVSNSLIRGSGGDDMINFTNQVIANDVYGDDGNDVFRLDLSTPKNDLWGGPGCDIYRLENTGILVMSSVIHDFDFRAPVFGGDMIQLSNFGISDSNQLQLQQVAEETDTYLLSTTGDNPLSLLTLIGHNLTLDQLADNLQFL